MVLYMNGINISLQLVFIHDKDGEVFALEVDCIIQSYSWREKPPAVALLPALRMPQSSAAGAAWGLHSGS